MPDTGGQKRPGYHRTAGGNRKSGGSPMNDPLAGKGATQTSSHYDRISESPNKNRGGKVIEGQDLRGFVRGEKVRSIGAVSDATTAPDGTKRVRKL